MPKVEIAFAEVTKSRRGSSRAIAAVRAKVVHTARHSRHIEIFIPRPVYTELGWHLGGRLHVKYAAERHALYVSLAPSHSGPKLAQMSRATTTARVTVVGDFVRQNACAPVRIVPHRATGDTLLIELPASWARESSAKEAA